MRFRDNIICILCLLVGVSLLFTASTRLEHINKTRYEMGLISTPDLKDAPPALAFSTVALGAFRGIIVDVLWLRAEASKDAGKFYDAKQLAEWISMLQPRFAKVWDFQAWNMAYNISVAMPNSQWQERWKWVRNGYELLRDKGLEYNPENIYLYRSLAWIFQHKIGNLTDDCHKHYKRELALEIRPLLRIGLDNTPPTIDYYQALSDAPEEISEIKTDPAVAAIIDSLVKMDPVFEDEKKFSQNYLLLRQKPGDFDPALFNVIDANRDTEALRTLNIFTRAYMLRSKWKMDPKVMQQINKRYGPTDLKNPEKLKPLNWELADTHAIYWGQLGLDRAGKEGVYSVDEKNADRIVFHSLQNLYRWGNMFMYSIPGREDTVFLRTDLSMFDSCNKGWIERVEKYEAFDKKGNANPIRQGHKNMLEQSVFLFYQAGHKEKAIEIFRQLRGSYPRPEYNVDLVTYVQKKMAEKFESINIKDATDLIVIPLMEAFFRYAVYDDDQTAAREKWAKQIYDLYIEEYGVNLELDRENMPSFERLRYLAFQSFMGDYSYPEEFRMNLIARLKVEDPDLFNKLVKQEEEFIKSMQK